MKGHHMPGTAEKSDVAHQFLTGLQKRDWDLLRSIMTEDIVWSLPGSSLISGEAHGLDAVIKRSQLIVSYGLTFTLKNILYGQYGVALSLHNTAKRGNLVLDEHLATVCLLREGKICAINSYLSDVDMLNAFFV
jgi:ketosteroid isomerase-like protein